MCAPDAWRHHRCRAAARRRCAAAVSSSSTSRRHITTMALLHTKDFFMDNFALRQWNDPVRHRQAGMEGRRRRSGCWRPLAQPALVPCLPACLPVPRQRRNLPLLFPCSAGVCGHAAGGGGPAGLHRPHPGADAALPAAGQPSAAGAGAATAVGAQQARALSRLQHQHRPRRTLRRQRTTAGSRWWTATRPSARCCPLMDAAGAPAAGRTAPRLLPGGWARLHSRGRSLA